VFNSLLVLMCEILRATVSAVSCLVVPAFICIDLLLISRVLKINDDDDADDADDDGELNCTSGVSFSRFHCSVHHVHGLWPSWYRPVCYLSELTDEVKEGNGDDEIGSPVEARCNSNSSTLDVGRKQLT